MRFLYCLLFAFCLALSVQGRVWAVIDTFATLQPPLVFIDNNYNAADIWYSPYGGSAQPPGAVAYHTTTDCLSGQRDVIIGYETVTPANSVAIAAISARTGSIAFPLGYVGGVYFQYDGADNGGSSAAFPGSILNISPGIGSGGNPFGISGQFMDFTFGGKARYVTTTIIADHQVNYFFDARDTSGTLNEFATLVTPISEQIPVIFTVAFDDPNWTNRATFDWTRVAAFQVKVFTFTTGGQSQAVDTSFKFLNITGYEVAGTVIIDCNCDTTTDNVVSGAIITLQNPSTSATIATTTTDSNGDFTFYGLSDGNYRVCIPASLTRCSGTTQCKDITLANLVDPAHLLFSTTIASVLSIPANANLQCGACITPQCLGFASTSGCSGTTQVNTFTDSTTTNGCVVTTRRTWTANGQSLTQIITVSDTLSPVISPGASSLSFSCDAITTPINTWISTQGGAAATDCSTFTWTNNWDNTAPVRCQSKTVTFTARDICGNPSVSTTATYSVTDNVAPTINTVATNSQAPCDLKGGSDQTALTTWLNTRGGAQATDNCNPSVTWTNNFTPLTSGCLAVRTVTFTAADGCGNSAATTATFTISDTTAPTITVAASAASAQCTGSGTSAQTAFNTWRADHGGARATDACVTNDNQLVWTDDFTGTVTGGCNSAFPVTFTVTDQCGLSSRTTASFTVVDQTGPTLTTAAQPLSIECGGDISGSYNTWLANNAGAVATDTCTSVVWSNNAGPAPTNGCNSVSTVTFRATDLCSNPAVQTTATFTVRDTVPPTFVNSPSNSGQECSSSVTTGFNAWLASNAGATATDTCSLPVTISNDFPANGTPSLGCNAVTSVRFTATDACGRSSAPQTATYTITDTTAPLISPGASDTNVECNSSTNPSAYSNFLSTRGGAQATDFCSQFTWTNNGPATITLGCSVTQTVTFTARDTCGNFDVTTATFTINDTVPPVLTLPAQDLTTQCSSTGTTTAITNWVNSRGGATASDACTGVTWTNDWDGTLVTVNGCTSAATVTFSAADSCGFTVQTTATFTVTDSTGPTINPPAQSLTVQCDPDTQNNAFQDWVNNHGGAVATDNCVPSNLLIWSASASAPSDQSCSATTVTFTVADGCGSSSSTTALFTIIDTAKPLFTTPPQDLTVECDGLGNTQAYADWVDSFGGAVADDECAFSLVYSSNAPDVGPVGCGSQPQTITVIDECNNAAIASSIFTVRDTLPPAITTPATDTAVQCNPNTNVQDVAAFLSNHGGAQATDVCYATNTLTWTNDFVSLSSAACNPSARVTFTVTDPCGQRASTTATITIVDTLVPILSSAATPAVFECNIDTNPAQISTYVTTHGGAQATDSCSNIIWTNNFVTPPVPCAAPLPIIFIASDACGNRISTSGSVQIIDSVKPDFVDFPADATVGCDQSSDPEETGVPGWFDACSSNLVPEYSDVTFQEPPEKFCPGDIITTRTWSLTDECGNQNTKDQIIVEEIARSTGPCLPQDCPPCELIECCTQPLDDIACNPVACQAVVCSSVHCNPVPCIPQACGSNPTPTGNPEGPVPLPSVLPAPSCEPVYIYVFDDDGEDVPDEPVPVYTTADASVLGVSLISLVIILLTIF